MKNVKFKYTGPGKQKVMELVAFSLMEKNEELKPNQIIEVPEEYKRVISALDVSGYFTRVEEEKKTKTKAKSTKKEAN